MSTLLGFRLHQYAVVPTPNLTHAAISCRDINLMDITSKPNKTSICLVFQNRQPVTRFYDRSHLYYLPALDLLCCTGDLLRLHYPQYFCIKLVNVITVSY